MRPILPLLLLATSISALNIFVQTRNGTIIPVTDINPKDPISVLKPKIEGKLGQLPEDFRLIYDGQLLDQQKSFRDYFIRANTVIHYRKAVGSWSIFSR